MTSWMLGAGAFPARYIGNITCSGPQTSRWGSAINRLNPAYQYIGSMLLPRVGRAGA